MKIAWDIHHRVGKKFTIHILSTLKVWGGEVFRNFEYLINKKPVYV